MRLEHGNGVDLMPNGLSPRKLRQMENERVARRQFREAEVLDVLFAQGATIPCKGCGKPITKRDDIERDHKIALATLPGGMRAQFDTPDNCRYICSKCHLLKTNGPERGSVYSDRAKIAKQKRIGKDKSVRPKAKIQSRGFPPSKRALRKLQNENPS